MSIRRFDLSLTPSRRNVVLNSLRRLPKANVASDDEVMRFVDREALFGIGIEYVDAHLLAATRLTPEATFWARNRRLATAAEKLSLTARSLH